MSYRKHFLLIKKLIKKDFSTYKKRFLFNKKSKFYQVDFILEKPRRILNLAILPNVEYPEIKQKIQDYINHTIESGKKCGICNNASSIFCYCSKCSFIMCLKCSDKIYLENCFVFICPKCGDSPPQPPDIANFFSALINS